MCSTGHPWLDGVPSCTCDAISTDVDGYVKFTVEPLPDTGKRTVVGPTVPTTRSHASLRAPGATSAFDDDATPAGGSAVAVAEAPILSEDGWWQWDGEAWVPADTAPSATAPVDLPARVTPPSTADPEAYVRPGPPAEEVPEWAAWSTPVGPGAAPGSPSSPPPPAAYAPPPGWNAPPPAYGPPAFPPPPPYGYGPTGAREREGFAIAALVCSLVPIFAIAQVLAFVFAIVTLVRVGKSGKKGQVMAICAMAVSVVMLFISAAIAIPVFLEQRDQKYDAQVKAALRDTATAEETYLTEYGRYTQAAGLSSLGVRLPTDVEVDVAADGAVRYCLAGAHTGGGGRWFLYDSEAGGLQTTTYATADAAITTCEQGGSAGGGTSGGGTSGNQPA